MQTSPRQLTLFELDADNSPGPTGADPAPPPPAPTPAQGPSAAVDTTGAVALLAGLLGELRQAPPAEPAQPDLRRARDDWLRRLQAGRRSESTITAYRIAIDDLLAWCGERERSIFDEATIVDHLADYQRRADPAPATYYRRFGLLRRFVRP